MTPADDCVLQKPRSGLAGASNALSESWYIVLHISGIGIIEYCKRDLEPGHGLKNLDRPICKIKNAEVIMTDQ